MTAAPDPEPLTDRTIAWDGDRVAVIDQTALPHRYSIAHWVTVEDAARGIARMEVRGAPLIGVAAAHAMALAARADPSDASLDAAARLLAATRPTAVNLRWALDRVHSTLRPLPDGVRADRSRSLSEVMADEDAASSRALGHHGAGLLRHRAAEVGAGPGRPLSVLTHCNAGRLAAVERGTATAPLYQVHEEGMPVHVWVSETRPRNQGAALTSWELAHAAVPHTIVADNACGHLIATGQVDVVLVGTDRTAANGDVANKIGTYLKALAAAAAGIPFWVAAPTPSIDPACADGGLIPIEERDPAEVTTITGWDVDGTARTVRLTPEGARAANPAFDVTPAALVSALITERGVVPATPGGVASLGLRTHADPDASDPQARD